MARVMTSGSLSKAGRPVFDGCSEAWSSFHQSSTSAYNETKKESRSIATPSFGESLVKHTVWAPSPLVRVTHQSSKAATAQPPHRTVAETSALLSLPWTGSGEGDIRPAT